MKFIAEKNLGQDSTKKTIQKKKKHLAHDLCAENNCRLEENVKEDLHVSSSFFLICTGLET